MMPAKDADAYLAELSADKRATPKKVRKAIRAAAPGKPRAKVAAGGASPDPAVVAYLRDLDHPLTKEIKAVRLIVLGASPAIREGIKWNVPSFRTDKEWFATFNVRAKDTVQLVFHLGAKIRPDQKAFKLADPRGLVKWLGKDRAMVTLGAGRDIPANRKALEALVRAWIEYV
jgi:hypothetical protein